MTELFFDQAELDFFRDDTERLFNAECTLFRYVEGTGSTDPVTLEDIPGDPEVVYSGPCLFAPTTRSYERSFTQAEARHVSRTYSFRLPVSVTDVFVGDLIEVTAGLDSKAVGRTFTVIDPQTSSQSTDRKIIAELNLGF